VNQLSILTLSAYILLLIIIWYFWRWSYKREIFRIRKKLSWLVGAVSLFMYLNTPIMLQLASEVVRTDGIPGLWLLTNSLMAAAVVPIVFAPMWRKLELTTDNEFILLRYSGVGSKILYTFRAIYLGVVISPILVSYQLLAFSSFLSIVWDVPMNTAIAISCAVLFISSIKNSLGITMRTDLFHGLLYASSLGLLLFWLLTGDTGQQVLQHSVTWSVFPASGDHKAWAGVVVLLTIQWWSTGLFDGGGPEMQKYNSVHTPRKAVLLAMGAVLLSVGFSLLNIFISLKASGIHPDGFLPAVKTLIPSSLKMLITLGFWAAYITTAESSLNWGSSYVVENIWYRDQRDSSSTVKFFHSFFIIFLLAGMAAFITLAHDSLRSILELLFSFSAGVAPVFFLRWFWMRINAWAQLSAMIAGTVLSILYDAVEPYMVDVLRYDLLAPYYWKLIILTIATTLTWITVMYLTPPDDPGHIANFKRRLPDKKIMWKRFFQSLLLGLLLLVLYVVVMSLIVGF
jgi:Na+/proline symporter